MVNQAALQDNRHPLTRRSLPKVKGPLSRASGPLILAKSRVLSTRSHLPPTCAASTASLPASPVLFSSFCVSVFSSSLSLDFSFVLRVYVPLWPSVSLLLISLFYSFVSFSLCLSPSDTSARSVSLFLCLPVKETTLVILVFLHKQPSAHSSFKISLPGSNSLISSLGFCSLFRLRLSHFPN